MMSGMTIMLTVCYYREKAMYVNVLGTVHSMIQHRGYLELVLKVPSNMYKYAAMQKVEQELQVRVKLYGQQGATVKEEIRYKRGYVSMRFSRLRVKEDRSLTNDESVCLTSWAYIVVEM
jgi:hypothetical protein